MSSTLDAIKDKQSLYIKASPAVTYGAFAAIGVGVVVAAAGFGTGQGTRVWGAYLFNLFFFFALSFGAMALAAITDVIGATWNRPIRRIQEGFGSFLPVAAVLFLVFFAATALNLGHGKDVYSWIAKPESIAHFRGKNGWLKPGLFYARCAFLLLGFTYLAVWQLRLSTGRDQLWVDGKDAEAHEKGEEVRVKTRFWSAPILIFFGVGFTFFVFDVTMSLAPTWFSTLWGGWHFAVMMQTLMASLLITSFILKGNTFLGDYIKRQQLHDLGKLMHGFTVFFAYLTYAHVLTYWYGNMPEETSYFIARLERPWLYFVFAIPLLGFVFPLYSLIFKASKWTSYIAIPIAGTILFAQWCTYLLIVMPQTTPTIAPFPWVEVGLFVGMAGAFVSTFLVFAKRHPMLPIADPLLAQALDDGHH